jgi:hypothetical protein
MATVAKNRKRCYRKSTLSRICNKFLQHFISCPKENREDENGDKYETLKHSFKENTLQNEHIFVLV